MALEAGGAAHRASGVDRERRGPLERLRLILRDEGLEGGVGSEPCDRGQRVVADVQPLLCVAQRRRRRRRVDDLRELRGRRIPSEDLPRVGRRSEQRAVTRNRRRRQLALWRSEDLRPAHRSATEGLLPPQRRHSVRRSTSTCTAAPRAALPTAKGAPRAPLSTWRGSSRVVCVRESPICPSDAGGLRREGRPRRAHGVELCGGRREEPKPRAVCGCRQRAEPCSRLAHLPAHLPGPASPRVAGQSAMGSHCRGHARSLQLEIAAEAP